MKIAAITMTFNETTFLPIWLHYYASQLGYENLYIIDHRSNDTSIWNARKKGALNIIRMEKEELDEEERAIHISLYHERLLKDYHAVIYTDVDEIIIPDPLTHLTLREYINERVETYVNAFGLNVIHNIFEEPKLDVGQPLFRQRSYIKPTPWYCKPLISKVPMRWSAGFHFSNEPRRQALDLFLFHLRAMDFDIAKDRIRTLSSVKRSKRSIENNQGDHFGWSEEKYLSHFFPNQQIEFQNAREDFEFSNLATMLTSPLFDFSKFKGNIYRIPERFLDSVSLL
jgi:hypothetical protein